MHTTRLRAFKSISVTGMLLLGISTIITAIAPAKTVKSKPAMGLAGFNNGGSYTCSQIAGGIACGRTNSGTTLGADGTSDFVCATPGNTDVD